MHTSPKVLSRELFFNEGEEGPTFFSLIVQAGSIFDNKLRFQWIIRRERLERSSQVYGENS